MKRQNLIGQTFGDWIVISKDSNPRNDNHIYYICQCKKCHKQKSIRSTILRKNPPICNCLDQDNIRIKNLTGQHFGRWTVLYMSQNQNGHHIKWHCRCSCEKHTQRNIDGVSLRRGLSLSCGCLTQSRGEAKIASLLKKNNIPFQQEKTFKNCIFPDSKWPARFDFYVNQSYLIEFDGKQHFEQINNSQWSGLKYNQEHDEFKNNWCIQNNITLIRIPYYRYNNLSIEDLLDKTSKYIYFKGEKRNA